MTRCRFGEGVGGGQKHCVSIEAVALIVRADEMIGLVWIIKCVNFFGCVFVV